MKENLDKTDIVALALEMDFAVQELDHDQPALQIGSNMAVYWDYAAEGGWAWRAEDEDEGENSGPIDSLDDLRAILADYAIQ